MLIKKRTTTVFEFHAVETDPKEALYDAQGFLTSGAKVT